MQEKSRCLSIFVFSFILIISSMLIIGVGVAASNSLTATQHTSYSPSQENQTEFLHYRTDSTVSPYPAISPEVMIDVVDQDGVAMVWFSYKRSNESQWSNQSMQKWPALGENTFYGSSRVTLSKYTNIFDIKFFANDSLGHVAESEVYELLVYYNPPDPPPDASSLPIRVAIFAIIVVSLIIIAFKLKRR